MPRVRTQTARQRKWTRSDKRLPGGVSLGDLKPHYKCSKCREEILPGETYHVWSFRYGGTYRRCYRTGCYPRPSDLTQSKMAVVLEAIETATDTINSATNLDDINSAIAEVRDTVDEVKQEYTDAAEQFGSTGPSQDKADELEGFVNDLYEEISSTWTTCEEHDEVDRDDEPEHETCERCMDAYGTWVDEIRSEAIALFENCP